jgi:hypothetical protein
MLLVIRSEAADAYWQQTGGWGPLSTALVIDASGHHGRVIPADGECESLYAAVKREWKHAGT